jgi:hypothetical protein
MYPSGTPCDSINKLFPDNNGSINEAEYLKYALLDKNATLNSKGAGFY